MVERGFFDGILDFADGAMSAAEKVVGAARPDASNVQGRNPRQQFRIVEVIEEDGSPIFIVTDGANNADCSSREFAERVQRALG